MSQPEKPKQDRLQELSKQATVAHQKFEAVQFEVARERVQFFERLAILSGSSIALSLTFLGYIQSRPRTGLSDPALIYTAWFFLLGCLVTALLRNLRHQDYFYYFGASSYLRKRAELVSFEVSLVEDRVRQLLTPEGAAMSEEERQEFAGELRGKAKSLGKEAHRFSRKTRLAEVMWRGCECAAELFFVVGLLLLVGFAVVNTR